MNLRSRNRVLDTFNMSSLTDIIFLLLIFFMLTSTLVVTDAIDVNLPQADKPKTPTTPALTLSIDKDLNYYIGQEKIAFNQIRARFKSELNANEKPVVLLNAEKSVPIDNVVQVLTIGYDMKINIILATQPKK